VRRIRAGAGRARLAEASLARLRRAAVGVGRAAEEARRVHAPGAHAAVRVEGARRGHATVRTPTTGRASASSPTTRGAATG
jgi:hypothetical protein